MSNIFLFTCDTEGIRENTEEGIKKIAALLCKNEIKGTFFCTHDILLHYPKILDFLQAMGHEIASHGFRHSWFNTQGKRLFLDNIPEELIEEEIEYSYTKFKEAGFNVKGYRAPALRVNTLALYYIQKYFEYEASAVQPFFLKNYESFYKKKLLRIPITRLKTINVRFSSSYLLFNWKVLFPFIKQHLMNSQTTCFYCHSYDLISMTPNNMNLKKILISNNIYYNRCGTDSTFDFFNQLLMEVKKSDHHCLTCSEYMKLMKNRQHPDNDKKYIKK